MSFKVQRVWVFLAIHDDGGEGVVATHTPHEGWIPFVATDEKRLADLRSRASAIARDNDMSIRVACFEQRTDVEIIDPNRTTQRS